MVMSEVQGHTSDLNQPLIFFVSKCICDLPLSNVLLKFSAKATTYLFSKILSFLNFSKNRFTVSYKVRLQWREMFTRLQ